jgi:hypothetical protein
MKDIEIYTEEIIRYWFWSTDHEGRIIRRYAGNIKEAWEKTFTKWYLIALHSGKVPYDLLVTRCGLCDIYSDGGLTNIKFVICKNKGGCPIYNDSKKEYCKGVEPFINLCKDYTEEYTQSELILQQILYLIKVYKDTMK